MFVIKIIFIISLFIAIFLIAYYYIQRYQLILKLKKSGKTFITFCPALKATQRIPEPF